LKRTHKSRTARGASIILVALFAIGLIILVFIAFQFAMVMGGSREVRNAVDAGTLNMAKRTQELQLPPDASFRDVANTSGQVGISNLSRVLGKAFLINANVQDMQNTGGLSAQATANADAAYQSAQTLNDNLCAALKNKQTLDNYFNDMALAKNANLLGASATVTSQTQDQQSSNSQDQQKMTSFATAMVDRGDESNLSFAPSQLPKGINVTPVQKGNKNYLQGYVPLTANGKEFTLPTFHLGEQPHLISDDYFQKNKSDTTGGIAGNPIPNAYRESGLVNGSINSLTAAACAVANPQRQYTLAIPYGYTTITFVNIANWYVNGKKIKTTPYGNEPEQQYEIKHYQPLPTSGGFMDGGANLGNEFQAQNLWMLYNKLGGDHTTALNKMVQRMQEVDPTFNSAKMQTLLNQQNIKKSPTPIRYYIYPTYKSPDNTDPAITIADLSSGGAPAWISKAFAEGEFVPLTTEEPLKDDPNTNFETITGGKYTAGKHWTTFNGVINWKPGTGYNQCLGDLQIARVTNLYFTDDPP